MWRADFRVTLDERRRRAVEQTMARYAASPYAPPNAAETLTLLGEDEALLDALIDQGQLRRMQGNVLFRGEDADAMFAQIRQFIAAEGSISLAQARDLFNTSRKYVQAVLEEMDAQRITRREGDVRVLRNA
ncbi:MAG: SelB C-terminal domain-containing protein [Caldilineaceae bacterium]